MKLKKEYLLLIGIIPFILIGFYTEPIADDYAYAYRLQLRPYWSAYLHEYFSWNGRYTSNLLVLLNDRLISNRVFYHLAPGVIIISLVASIYYFFSAFLTKRNAIQFASFAVLIYLGSCVRISEVIYWYTATVTYTMGTILTLLTLGALMHFSKNKKLPMGLLACLFILLSSGTNEISMAINILVAIIYLSKGGYGRFIILATAIIAAGLVYLAPGNEVRSGFFPNAHNIPYSLGMAALQTIRFTGLTLAYLLIPISILMIWRNVNFEKFNKRIIAFIDKTNHFWIFIGLFTPLFLSAFMPYYATGLLGQHRSIAFGQFYLTTGFLVVPLILFVKSPFLFLNIKHKIRQIPSGFYMVSILVSFLLLGNTHSVWLETATGALAKQQNELLHRENQIRNANQEQVLFFQPLDTTLLFVIDLGENPDYWINKHQCTVLNPEGNVKTIVQ